MFSVAIIVVNVAGSQVDDLNNLCVNLLSGKMLTSCEIKSTTFKLDFICHLGVKIDVGVLASYFSELIHL